MPVLDRRSVPGVKSRVGLGVVAPARGRSARSSGCRTKTNTLELRSFDVLGEKMLLRGRTDNETELAVRLGDALDELVFLLDLLEVRRIRSDDPAVEEGQRRSKAPEPDATDRRSFQAELLMTRPHMSVSFRIRVSCLSFSERSSPFNQAFISDCGNEGQPNDGSREQEGRTTGGSSVIKLAIPALRAA